MDLNDVFKDLYEVIESRRDNPVEVTKQLQKLS